MNEETKKFLLQCKEVGYEHIAICVADKRVPASMKVEKFGERRYSKYPSSGDYWGQITAEDGTELKPPKVVSAAPDRRESGRPAIWKICEESVLTAGLLFRGCGCGEAHEISRSHTLERGYYDLTQPVTKHEES